MASKKKPTPHTRGGVWAPFSQQQPTQQPDGAASHEPLLPTCRQLLPDPPPTSQQEQEQEQAAQHKPNNISTVDLGSRFVCRLWAILRIINAMPALVLVVVSLAETVIVSKIGTISGLFYQVFVDGQSSRVPQLMLWSAGCYTATALFYALKSGLQDFFAWRWRARLTVQLQQLYCSRAGAVCPKSKEPLLQSLLDSPDQRVAQDLPLLTASLSEVLTQLAAVPFNIIWYTHLTQQVFGSWLPVVWAYLFFLLGLVLQRLVMLPVAAAVFRLEAAEGAFRYSHTRFRAWASEIAMYRAEPVEQQFLEGQLSGVLVCQGRLMLRRAVLAATSRLLEYGGLVVNFGCLATAVFSGAWSGQGQSAGDIASKVSVASFYLLTLIYNFTQVLDLASKVANLAGLTARVGQMLEALAGPTEASQHSTHSAAAAQQHQASLHDTISSSSSRKQGAAFPTQSLRIDPESPEYHQHHQQPLQEVAAGKSPSHQRYASQAILLQPPALVIVPAADSSSTCQDAGSSPPAAVPRAEAEDAVALRGSTSSTTSSMHQDQLFAKQQQQPQEQQQPAVSSVALLPAAHPDMMQVSLHSMGADMLLQEVRRAFPDSPRLAPLLAVVTFQFCGAAKAHMLHALQQQQQLQPQQPQQQPAPADDSCCHGCTTGSAACGGAVGSPGLCADADMQHMLAVFLTWQQAVYNYITSRGYWCDTIDPRSGTALHSTAGSHYDEVIGASVLLGYERVTPPGQTFSLISHPQAATQVYPATLFTSAPLPLVKEALRAAAVPASAGVPAAGTEAHTLSGTAAAAPYLHSLPPQEQEAPDGAGSSSLGSGGCKLVPARNQSCSTVQAKQPHQQQQQQNHHHHLDRQQLLSCSGLTLSTPSGVPVVRGLSMEVVRGACVLIQGPSGCGKSSLLRCLAGLWPADCGRVTVGAAAAACAAYRSCGTCAWDAVDAAALVVKPQHRLDSTAGHDSSLSVMFVPQRALAAPGATLRQQLLYPAPAAAGAGAQAWTCMCAQSGMLAAAQQGRAAQVMPQSSKQQRWTKNRPRTMRRNPSSSSGGWWLNWLSCGLMQTQEVQVPSGTVAFKPSLALTAAAAAGCQDANCSTHCLMPCPSCQHLLSVLDQVGLSYLVSALPQSLHTQCDAWGDVLSPGELQRLTFARVLLQCPALVVLDEATSSLPDAAAVQLYRQLQAAGISFVSVGHSSCLADVHHMMLSIHGDGSGSWDLSVLQHC